LDFKSSPNRAGWGVEKVISVPLVVRNVPLLNSETDQFSHATASKRAAGEGMQPANHQIQTQVSEQCRP